MLTALQYSIGQLLRFLVRLRPRYLRNAFTWLDYRLFFRGNRIHFRQRIWGHREDNSATIDDAFGRLPAGCQVFVKIDFPVVRFQVNLELLRANWTQIAFAFLADD